MAISIFLLRGLQLIWKYSIIAFVVIVLFDITLADQISREAFFLAWNNLATAAFPFFPQMLASFALFIMFIGIAVAPIFLIDRLKDKLKSRMTSN